MMCHTLKIAGIVKESIVDGPGFRYAIFTQGCAHACPECQNPETWDFNAGYEIEFEKILSDIDIDPLLDGVTFSGGDPMYQPEACYELSLMIKERGLNIVTYTGFTYEELLLLSEKNHWISDFMSLIDILIDGRYDKGLRDLTLSFRGSSNQRIIDMNRTRAEGRILLDDRYR